MLKPKSLFRATTFENLMLWLLICLSIVVVVGVMLVVVLRRDSNGPWHLSVRRIEHEPFKSERRVSDVRFVLGHRHLFREWSRIRRPSTEFLSMQWKTCLNLEKDSEIEFKLITQNNAFLEMDKRIYRESEEYRSYRVLHYHFHAAAGKHQFRIVANQRRLPQGPERMFVVLLASVDGSPFGPLPAELLKPREGGWC